jgi:hypothetical protein
MQVHRFENFSIDDLPATVSSHAFTASGRKFRTARTQATAISATHSQLPAPQR